jgi:SAM-dependent methyltransferase
MEAENPHLKQTLIASLNEEGLISAVLSSPQAKEQKVFKIIVRPILLKGKVLFQASEHYSQKVIHHNYTNEECLKLLYELLMTQYKQGILHTEKNDYHILIGKKNNVKIIRQKPSKSKQDLLHNRPKQYLLHEGEPIAFLIELGIMNQCGRVYAGKRDKFKQMNRFLEIVSDILPALEGKKKITILDFGCGKAYLTFALYHYLHCILDYELEIIGLDLKEEVIAHCQSLADQIGYSNLHFHLGDINSYEPKGKIDLMVTLHACDTATDAALEKAVHWQADVILSVPCCQHELYSQVSNSKLFPLLQHGILKEKFAALATDAARGKLLEVLGYSVQIMEFIDLEHTPKNILIRAVRKPKQGFDQKALASYREFKQLLNIYPSLEKRFEKLIPKIHIQNDC